MDEVLVSLIAALVSLLAGGAFQELLKKLLPLFLGKKPAVGANLRRKALGTDAESHIRFQTSRFGA